MSLIKCPECKKEISDKCEKCPQCGYPIKNVSQDKSANIDESKTVKTNQPFYKKIWVWFVVGISLVGLVCSILLLNYQTKPRFDKDGNPIFVEFTNEVYTNAKKYKGYHVNIKGKVFQVISDNGNVKGIQIWLDPDTCEQNMMIYYNSDAEIKQGDYIICSGYIDSVTEYKNAYDAKLYAPLVISTDLKKSTYVEVMAPTIETITTENLKQEKYGYSVTIEKIEFAKKETRVYVRVTNNGESLLYFGDAIIVQESKQFNSTTNYEAGYEEIPYEIVKGVSSSGIIVFPAMGINDFELSIEIHSDNSDEKLGEIVFSIGKENTKIKTPWPIDEIKTEEKPSSKPTQTYPTAVGIYQRSNHTLSIYKNGTLYLSYNGEYMDIEGTWYQSGSTICYSVWNIDGFEWNNPSYGTVYNDGIDFLGDYYNRQ